MPMLRPERIENHARLLLAVAKSAEELVAAGSIDACMDAVLERLGQATRADRACLCRVHWTPDDPRHLGSQEITHEWTRSGAVRRMDGPQRAFRMLRSDPGWPMMQKRYETERRILWHIESCGEPFRTRQSALGVGWSLMYPIVVEGVVWGGLAFDYASAVGACDEADLAALQTVASTLTEALQRQGLERRALEGERARADENERLVTFLQVVVKSSKALLDALAFEPALQRWLGEIGSVARADRATYYDFKLDERSGVNTARVLGEWADAGVARTVSASFEQPFVVDPRGGEDAMIRLDSARITVFHADERAGAGREFLRRRDAVSFVAVPIFQDGVQRGCLAFDYGAPRELSAGEVAILQSAADTLVAIFKRNAAAASAISEREARIAVQQRRFSELADANDALRVSLDALADTEGEDGFFRQSLIQIRTQAGAYSAYLFACDGPDAKLRLIGSVTEDTFSAEGQADDPPMFRDGFRMVPALLEQLTRHGRLVWRRVDPHAVIDDDTPESVRWHVRLGHRANALHALMVGTRQVGLIGLVFGTDVPPTEARQELVHTLCQPLTLALELARLATQARASAEHAAVLGERDRMAAEIHDSLAQSFTSIAMQSESLAGRLSADPPSARVLRLIEQTARAGLAEARASVLALRPLDAAPGALDRALAQLVERSSVQGSIECRFVAEGVPRELPGALRESLLRIAQEATGNAMRHSGGRNVRIGLAYLQRLVRLTVEDDGRGLALAGAPALNGGFGIPGMQARAAAVGGTVAFERSRHGGLLVTVEVPCRGMERPPP